MDCNATCHCDTGCGNGWPFCETGCDGVGCGCGPGGCNSWATGCFQFRYGQCNQNVACMGRIVCRVVACIPPWEIDASCTTTSAQDQSTAEQDAPCWSPGVPPPCNSPATNCQVIGIAASPDGNGYAILTSFGRLLAYGDFDAVGDESGASLNLPIAAMAARPGGGYWFVARDGGIFAFDAPYFGSMGGQPLDQPMVGMAATATGRGYWTVAADGGIFSFGDAGFLGSMGGRPLNAPIVGMAATPTGRGYWFVAADGGIFAFGDAGFSGSMGGQPLNRPIVGMAGVTGHPGYWLVGQDGGIFAFDAPFLGSPV